MPAEAFADRVLRRVRNLGHPLCLGIDPHIRRLQPCFFEGNTENPTASEKFKAMQEFCHAALERAAKGRVVAVKLQSAFFEQIGPSGMEVLAEVIQGAREYELPVILDAKRGDIGSSAEGYAAAYLEEGAPMQVDALTVNPWLGMETLEPFIKAAQDSGAGVFVLVKTSNGGGADFQDHGGRGAWRKLARKLNKEAKRLTGSESGFSGLGAVVGATKPEAARRARKLMPNNLFLAPGYGTQGGTAEDAVAGFRKGTGGVLEGGLVNASRSLLFPSDVEKTQEVEQWEVAVDVALKTATRELSDATVVTDQQKAILISFAHQFDSIQKHLNIQMEESVRQLASNLHTAATVVTDQQKAILISFAHRLESFMKHLNTRMEPVRQLASTLQAMRFQVMKEVIADADVARLSSGESRPNGSVSSRVADLTHNEVTSPEATSPGDQLFLFETFPQNHRVPDARHPTNSDQTVQQRPIPADIAGAERLSPDKSHSKHETVSYLADPAHNEATSPEATSPECQPFLIETNQKHPPPLRG